MEHQTGSTSTSEVTLTLYVWVERHVQHSPAQGIGRCLCARNDEFAHRIDEVLVGERGIWIPRIPLQLIQVGVDVVPWHVWHPALRELLYDPQEEIVHLSCVKEKLLVFSEGQILDPREGVVQEGPAAHCQLHVLTEELDHVLEVVVVVGEPLAKDDQVGDVGDGIGHEMLGIKGLPLVLVNGVDEEHALLRDLPLKDPLAAAEVTERVAGQLPVLDPAFAVFAVEKPLGQKQFSCHVSRIFAEILEIWPKLQDRRRGPDGSYRPFWSFF